MSSNNTTQKQIKISSDHPSLSGHFPGNPVLPGVVILDQIRLCIKEWRHMSLDGSLLKSVKFSSPVLISNGTLPLLDIVMEEKQSPRHDSMTKINFRCMNKKELIVQGVWLFRVEP